MQGLWFGESYSGVRFGVGLGIGLRLALVWG